MFTPSLLSLMWHTLLQGLRGEFSGEPTVQARSMDDVVRALSDLNYQLGRRPVEKPRVAMIGRTLYPPKMLDAKELLSSPVFLFGRVPIDELVTHLANTYERDASLELMDLGTPLSTAQNSASRRSLGRCRQRMSQTGQSGRRVSIALIDRGDFAHGIAPEDFGGLLQHAVKSGVDLSSHAVDVLDVLLDRLDYHVLLPECDMFCALVPPPPAPQNQIGLQCFDHVNSVELAASITALDVLLKANMQHYSQPVFANLSMGTHVGPHDGNSPLESLVQSVFDVSSDRFLHVAAGNDGLRGNAAQRRLSAGVAEYLRLRVGPAGTKEVLVELWWDPDPNTRLSVEVEISHAAQNLTPYPFTIDSTQAATLQVASHAGRILCRSLFAGTCYRQRSCIALALSVAQESDLSDVDIDLMLTSTADVVVNAWIVVCDDERSAFITGGTAGSIMVPATDTGVISVAGVTANGQPWAASSRGPTADYGQPQLNTAPYLAHRVDSGLSAGTSFASPRACADAANLKRPGTTVSWANAREAAKEIVKASTNLQTWNARTGFGGIA